MCRQVIAESSPGDRENSPPQAARLIECLGKCDSELRLLVAGNEFVTELNVRLLHRRIINLRGAATAWRSDDLADNER